MLMKSNSSVFTLFPVLSKVVRLHTYVSPMFFPKSFLVLSFTFKSLFLYMFDFELILCMS